MTVSTWIVTNTEDPDNPLPVPVPVDLSTAIAVAVDRASTATTAATRAEDAADRAESAAAGGVTWSGITGKPSAFLPVAHAHDADEVAGLAAHLAAADNPHGVTAAQVGLGNVDDTADADKPVSTAQAEEIAKKLDVASYTASDVLEKIKAVDGSGSGLDADVLRGVTPSDFGLSLVDDADAAAARLTLGLSHIDDIPSSILGADVATMHIPESVLSIRTSGYAAAGDGGGGLYRRVETQPTHAGRVQSDDGAWWELVHDGSVRIEQFGGFGAASHTGGMTDASAAFVAASAYAKAAGVPIAAVSAVYSIASGTKAEAARRVGAGLLYVGGVASPWETPEFTASRPLMAAGISDPSYPTESPLTTIADGSRWYDAFPRVHRLPSGRIVMTAHRGLAHAPSLNSPPDSELGSGYFGDVIVSYSDDDGSTWSTPMSITGNIAGGTSDYYVYTSVSGVDCDGTMLVLVRRVKISDNSTNVVAMKSRDGVVWSNPASMVITSIEDNPRASAGVSATGQPSDWLVFGDISRVPGASDTLCFMGRIGSVSSTTFDGIAGTITVINKYLVISYDNGATWQMKRCLRHENVPYQNNAGTLAYRWERAYPDASTSAFSLAEEGFIVPVSARDFITIHRISAITLLGTMSISRDGGATWAAVDEAVTGTTEQNGYAMPQAGHLAEVNGCTYMVGHIGVRTSGSSAPTSPYSHYVAIAKVKDIFNGYTDRWTIIKRQSFIRLFEQDVTRAHGIRDLYIGVVYDHETKSVLAVTHDEKLSDRVSALYSYRVELFDDASRYLVRTGAGAPASTEAVVTAGLATAYFDAAAAKLYIATANGVWKSVTLA